MYENQTLYKENKSLEKRIKNHVDMQHLRIIEEPEYSDSSGGGSVKNYDTEL